MSKRVYLFTLEENSYFLLLKRHIQSFTASSVVSGSDAEGTCLNKCYSVVETCGTVRKSKMLNNLVFLVENMGLSKYCLI